MTSLETASQKQDIVKWYFQFNQRNVYYLTDRCAPPIGEGLINLKI